MSNDLLIALLTALWQTLYMISVSGLLAVIVGLPIGILLATTQPNGILANKPCYYSLNTVVNIVRSIPFIILVVAIIPFTRFIIGTSIGENAAIIPLTIGAIPFMGRIVENSFHEIPHGLIEAGQAMGASALQITWHILLPEALSSIIKGITLTLITLLGYSAMAGTVGAGGLGYLAINYGYERFNATIIVSTVIILIGLVQFLQTTGDWFATKFKKL